MEDPEEHSAEWRGAMAIFLEEIMEVVRDHGLDGEAHQGWMQVPPGVAGQLPQRIYVQLTRCDQPIGQIHLSGFCIEHVRRIPDRGLWSSSE